MINNDQIALLSYCCDVIKSHRSGGNTEPLKTGTHEATNRCNTLLQQIVLCALIPGIGCSDQSPGMNTSTFDDRLMIKILSLRQNFVAV